MREHLHLTRVPEGDERDYIRGALAYYESEGKLFKIAMIVVNFIVSGILLASSVYGLSCYIKDGSKSLGTVILCFLFGLFWLFLSICLARVKNNIKNTNGFMNIRVWDVMLTEIHSSPNTSNASAKAVFADGTVSKNAFQAIYHNIHPYQYGLLVAICDVNGQWIYSNMIPRLEYGSKPYKFAQKGLRKIQ